jgi:hypothetical protein
MVYSEAKLKSDGDKASPISDNHKQEMHQTNVSFKHTLISLLVVIAQRWQ